MDERVFYHSKHEMLSSAQQDANRNQFEAGKLEDELRVHSKIYFIPSANLLSTIKEEASEYVGSKVEPLSLLGMDPASFDRACQKLRRMGIPEQKMMKMINFEAKIIEKRQEQRRKNLEHEKRHKNLVNEMMRKEYFKKRRYFWCPH